MLPDTEAIRLIVPQHSGIPEVMVEKLANHLLIRHIEPELSSLWTVSTLKTLIDSSLKAFNCKDCAYRVHTFSKKIHACAALEKALAHDISAFDATENNLIYTFDLSGNATGLYLDQRDNRIWIKNHAHGSVLNLFAYTCAFSLCAASSEQVTSTTSVDAAPAALQRGKLNFERNRISTDGHRFITEDALKYLAKCERNQVTFDTVICDPPSFGRFNKTVFSLENDMQNLLELCLKVASPGAVLLFSINHRKIHLQKLKSAWKQAVGKLNIQVKSVQIFTNDDATGPLGVGTDLKTIRAFL